MKKPNVAKFFDDFAIAGRGVLLATKRKDFWIAFVLTFLIFGTLINMLSGGLTSFKLMFSSPSVLLNAFLAIFGVGREIGDFLLNLVLITLQSTLIGLVVVVFKHNRAKSKEKKAKEAKEKGKVEDDDSGVSAAGIVAGLAVLGSGCPTCGTTLLTPIIGAILSGTTGAIKIAGIISTALNVVATLIAILVFRKLGVEVYAIIKSEQFKEKNHEENR